MKSVDLIKQWSSYLTEGLKNYDDIMEGSTDNTPTDQPTTSNKPNIIFCDIDGIIVDISSQDSDFENAQLNQEQYHIDPKAIEVLKDVCSKTNSKIVIDSAWTWVKPGEKIKMVGTTHKLRSRIPEIKKAIGEFLFEAEPLTPTLSKEEIPGNENVNFDEDGFPISANRKLKDGTVKEIPFNLSIMKPFCIAKWLNSHKNEIEKYVIIDNNTKSLKWGASKTNYATGMTNALMDMTTEALVSSKGNAILSYFGTEKNNIDDTVDMEVSENDVGVNNVNEEDITCQNKIKFGDKEIRFLDRISKHSERRYGEIKSSDNKFKEYILESQNLANAWDMLGTVSKGLKDGSDSNSLVNYLYHLGLALEHAVEKNDTDPRDIA